MRSLVGIITIIATVIHFTFGCCLHPCHFGGCGDCPAQASAVVACEECCHDHVHEDAASESDGLQCGQADVGLMAAGGSDGCHGCSGCDCAATSAEMATAFSWSPQASGIAATVDGQAIAVLAGASGKLPPDPCMHARGRRHALFERFLI